MQSNLFDLTGKIAVVSGASRGIGEAIAKLLAAHGAHVICSSRKADGCARVAEEIQAAGGKASAFACHVGEMDQIDALVEHVKNEHGRLDILVNNAGIALDDWDKSPSQQPLEVWRRTFETNLFGLVEVTRAFLPLLRGSAAGRVVNVSSVLGSTTLQADPASTYYAVKVPAYNVSKTAVNAWTVQLAYELRETAIKVNAIHPGNVRTDMNPGAELDVAEGARTSVQLALVGPDGPNGGFFHQGETLPW